MCEIYFLVCFVCFVFSIYLRLTQNNEIDEFPLCLYICVNQLHTNEISCLISFVIDVSSYRHVVSEH